MTLEEKVLEGMDKSRELEYLKEEITKVIAEESVRNGILNDVRQDAFKKLKLPTPHGVLNLEKSIL